MISLTSLLFTVHLLGLAFCIGASTVKVILLFRCKADHEYVPVFLKVVRPITRVIIIGLILSTLSGIVWLFTGYSFTTRMIIKIVLVAVIWILGPIIDNVLEPKVSRLAPAAGESASPEFTAALNRFLAIDTIAGGLFYVILVMWVLI